MEMRGEKPDTSRQSKGFEEVHAGLTVGQIAVLRSELRMCNANTPVGEIRSRNRDPVFDYLPVMDANGHLIGLLSEDAIDNASRDGDDARIGEYMDRLSEADLMGAGTPIVALIGRIRQKAVPGGFLPGDYRDGRVVRPSEVAGSRSPLRARNRFRADDVRGDQETFSGSATTGPRT